MTELSKASDSMVEHGKEALTDQEIEQARAVLAKMNPGNLPYPIFLEVARLTVTPIIEVVPVRKNPQGEVEVLLLKRDKSDTVWGGMLHTPGTVIRASDHEGDTTDAFDRIFQGELGGVETSSPQFVGTIFHRVKRGMEQASVFVAEVKGEPEVGIFYPISQLPDNVVDTQIGFIQAAVNAYEQANR